MTYIKKITMHGFKSFGDRTVSIRLAPGFTCIIGPNGAGKSNVIDALCFCLGRMSKKTMRAKNLSDLIFAGTKSLKPATSSVVSIVFDNSQGEFPVESDELEISRMVKAKGTSAYRLNGKNTTREQILNILAQGNIDPDGSNQFVLQGKIVELTHMNVTDRRQFIETLIGLDKYDQMKDQTFKELEKADRDLGKFEAIFKEVSTQLKKYEKEKNDALRWKELDEKIKNFNAELISIKIEKLQHEEADLERKMDEISVLISDLEQKQSRQKEKIEQENLTMSHLEDTLNEKNTEKDEIEQTLSSLKSELSAKETEIKLAKDNISKLEDRKSKLLNLQEKLEPGQTYDSIIEQMDGEIEGTKSEISETHTAEDETDAAIKETESKIAALENEKNDLKTEISNFKQEISSFEAEINVLNKNIKKSQKNLKNNETELKKLKNEEESIEQAFTNVRNEIDAINQQILDYKNEIEEDKKHQKDLENEISDTEKEKSATEKNLSDVNSKISSSLAEIKLYQQRIQDLNVKKKDLKKEYDRLSGGSGVDEALTALKNKESEGKTELDRLKKELDALNEKQKKNEQTKYQVELQRRSLENEMADYKTRISNIQTEIGIVERNLKNDLRTKTASELSIQKNKEELAKYEEELDKYKKKEETTQNRLKTLAEERLNLQNNVKIAEEQYENSKIEVDGVLQILSILTQDIDGAVGEIKSDIQNASETSINSSIVNFRGLFDDIVDLIKPIEEYTSSSTQDVKNEIAPMVETIKLFTDGIDDSLRAMINEVRQANDVAVQESTSKFDNLIADFIDIIENTNISLKRLTISKASEMHAQLEEIAEEIQNYTSASGQNSAQISKISTQIEAKTNELDAMNRNYDEVVKRVEDSQEKIKKAQTESEEKTAELEKAGKKIDEEIVKQEQDIKDFADNYWKDVKKLNSDIETKNDALNKIQDDLRELRDIQRYLDDMDNIDKEIVTINQEIEGKNTTIGENKKSAEKVEEEIKEIEIQIDELKSKRDEFWHNRQELDNKIEEQNESLKISTDKLRGLENIQRIINEIEILKADIQEAEDKIGENNKNKEVIELNISDVETQISGKDEIINGFRDEKDKLNDRQKELRTILTELNATLQDQQLRLNELSKMKERESEIEQIDEEINEFDISVGEMDVEIQELYDSLSKKEEERTIKLEEITKITAQRDASWEKQKKLRDELSEINSKQSAEMANLETSKNKKANITEKIENLYEQSKQYGNLPPPPTNETEDSLNGKIQKTTTEKVALEPVNLKAIEYYEEVHERFDEIDMRRQTLQRERKSILDSIEKIELEKQRTFMKAYHEINRQFSGVFQKLSPGGSAKMILERPDKPFEGGIMIEARPRGKKISSLDILSGGEKTLVALSFIFAVQTQFPAPFFVLDEIDSALDGPNTHRVSMVIKEFASQSQFLVISHRPENIMNAEMIYGVSQTDGLTSIFSVDVNQEQKRIEAIEKLDLKTDD